jgi:MEMO1 family protein
MIDETVIRQPAVSDMFYPGDPGILARDVDRLLRDASPVNIPGRIRAVVSPHAGYMYSGATAAQAYAALHGGGYSVVVVVSPSHHEFFEGVSVYSGSAYETPLGRMAVHAGLRNRLVQVLPSARSTRQGHGTEHAIEVQLPFLQRALGDVRILPLVVGVQRRDICFNLARALADLLQGEEALLVASSDLSHYHPSREADEIDAVVIDDITRFDFEKLMTDLELGHAEACGGGPIVSVMAAARLLGATKIRLLTHTNSGAVSGDRHRVVGYLSAVAYHEAAEGA